jgi:hypothetical protein
MSGIGLRNMMNDRNNVPTAIYRDSRLRMYGNGLFTVNLTIMAV